MDNIGEKIGFRVVSDYFAKVTVSWWTTFLYMYTEWHFQYLCVWSQMTLFKLNTLCDVQNIDCLVFNRQNSWTKGMGISKKRWIHKIRGTKCCSKHTISSMCVGYSCIYTLWMMYFLFFFFMISNDFSYVLKKYYILNLTWSIVTTEHTTF